MAGGLFGDCVDQEDLQISFAPSLELLLPLSSSSGQCLYYPWLTHILLFLTPCSNKGAICPVIKPI